LRPDPGRCLLGVSQRTRCSPVGRGMRRAARGGELRTAVEEELLRSGDLAHLVVVSDFCLSRQQPQRQYGPPSHRSRPPRAPTRVVVLAPPAMASRAPAGRCRRHSRVPRFKALPLTAEDLPDPLVLVVLHRSLQIHPRPVDRPAVGSGQGRGADGGGYADERDRGPADVAPLPGGWPARPGRRACGPPRPVTKWRRATSQQEAIEAGYLTGESFAIEASTGIGKTARLLAFRWSAATTASRLNGPSVRAGFAAGFAGDIVDPFCRSRPM
jgi:hypothetical protein